MKSDRTTRSRSSIIQSFEYTKNPNDILDHIDTIYEKLNDLLVISLNKNNLSHIDSNIKATMIHIPNEYALYMNNMPSHNRSSNALFADANIYAFFRLYQFLYDRLLLAKQLAYQHDTTSSTTTSSSSSSSSSYNPSNSSNSNSRKRKKVNNYTAKDKYIEYLSLLSSVINGSTDTSKYEDRLRTLLGTKSFKLFTIDKLIHHLLKHMLKITSSSISLSCISLYIQQALKKVYVQNLKGITNTDLIANSYLIKEYYLLADQMIKYLNTSLHIHTNDSYQLILLEYFKDNCKLSYGLYDLIPIYNNRPLRSILYPIHIQVKDILTSLMNNNHNIT